MANNNLDFSAINHNLGTYVQRKLKGLEDICGAEALNLESEAKAKRRWTDRTGDARKLLQGVTEVNEREIIIRLQHSSSILYGPALELGYAGRYSIIKPTIDRNRDRIIKDIKTYWEK